MIEEPPLLTIKSSRRRPTTEQLRAIRGTPTVFIVDAMGGGGALDSSIKPLEPHRIPYSLCGPALTCHCGPADILAILGSLCELQPGDILVAATEQWTGCAAIGDRVMGMLKNNGAAGFVTDGMARDLEGLVSVQLPVMCAGLSANSPVSKGPGTIGFPVVIGGVSVNSGDILVSDQDGVVVIPFDQIDLVIDRLVTVRLMEKDLDREVDKGLKVPEHIEALMRSSEVKRV